jgi:hypothetical protein
MKREKINEMQEKYVTFSKRFTQSTVPVFTMCSICCLSFFCRIDEIFCYSKVVVDGTWLDAFKCQQVRFDFGKDIHN